MPGDTGNECSSGGRFLAGATHKMRRVVTLARCYSPRLWNFGISLVGFVAITVVIWLLEPIEDSQAKVLATVAFAAMPFLSLLDGLRRDRQSRQVDLLSAWPSVLSLFILLVVLADRADLTAVVIGLISVLASLPGLWALWWLARGRRLMWFSIVPTIVAASLLVVPPVTPDGVELHRLFVPLPVVSYGSIVWVFITRWIVVRAERHRGRPISGPGMESLSMLLLFAPLIALTMLAVNALGFGDTWVAVSGVLVGLVFSSSISVPVRQFLLAMGNVSTKRESEVGTRADLDWY